MLNTFTFNGHTSNEFGIRIERMPALNRPARKFRAASVPGHNGNIYELQDAWEEIVQPYQIFAGDRNSNAVSNFSNIAEWLHSADGYAMLTDTYDPTHYREAIFVDSMDVESEWHTLGRATINFRCRPEHYIVTNPITVTSGGSVMNSTNHNAFPKITLTGGGVRSLLQLEGHTLSSRQYEWITQALNDEIAIKDTTVWMADAQLSGRMARLAGSINGTLNTLDDANGVIEYTPASGKWTYGIGIIKEVQPNTDYTISCEMKKIGSSNSWGYINVYLLSSTGYNSIIAGIKERVLINEAWKPISVSFTTPSECGYVLIAFTNSDNSTTKREIRNIMLNGGKTAKTFRGFAAPSTSTLTINDIKASITSSGFDTAVIDCEKESVLIDTANGNPNTQVLDKYGNLSASYLQMITGVNTITFDGDITAVSVEPRFWTL